NNIGSVRQAQGDLEGAAKAFERALAIDEKAFGPDHPSVARDVNNIGSVLQAQGDLEGAAKAFKRALRIFERALGPEHPKTVVVHKNLNWLTDEQAAK
ncbi:MAG: tetratricopeptide repeat protein, partial [Alphaproteobacteria bacterium]